MAIRCIGPTSLITAADGDKDCVVARWGPRDWFGHEEILSNSRRAFNACAAKGDTFCIRIPVEEYRKSLEDIHMGEFDAKVQMHCTGSSRWRSSMSAWQHP